MREVVIALGLIEQGDNYLLQLRGLNPQIGAAGMIGCFGGKIENDESPKSAVCRELAEETTLIADIENFEEIGLVRVVSDHKLEQVKVLGHGFKISVSPDMLIEAKEGEIISIARSDIPDRLHEMTPGTRAIFEQYILNGD